MKPIGEMNGAWTLLFRAALIVIPMIGGAVIGNRISIASIQASRFTAKDGQELRREVSELETKVAQVSVSISNIGRIESKVDAIRSELREEMKSLAIKIDRMSGSYGGTRTP